MKITKKRFVLVALFIFPLLFFLLLSTGINNFKKLPTLTQRVTNIKVYDNNHTFIDKVSIVCFIGSDVDKVKGSFFNLNQKIYKEFYGYIPFQLVAIYPEDSQEEVNQLKSKIAAFTDLSKWNFVGLSKEDIISFHASLKTGGQLDKNLYSNKAFIIDKESNLRGRDNDKDSYNGFIYGYDMNSVAELNNKMEDDVKVLLYEYRAAFKNKKKADRKKVEL